MNNTNITERGTDYNLMIRQLVSLSENVDWDIARNDQLGCYEFMPDELI